MLYSPCSHVFLLSLKELFGLFGIICMSLCYHSRNYGEGNGNPLQYSCLENPMDRGAWWAAVHGVAKNRTWLSDFTFTFHFHALEKEMATHSSVLAWRIPGTGEPGELPSMESHRVGHEWSNLAAAAAAVSLQTRDGAAMMLCDQLHSKSPSKRQTQIEKDETHQSQLLLMTVSWNPDPQLAPSSEREEHVV